MSNQTRIDPCDPKQGPSSPRARLGVSACLLGAQVRFDGGHKRDRYLTDEVAQWFDLVPVCPEVEIGLGTPRETIRLVRSGRGGRRLVSQRSGTDHTAAMEDYARKRVAELSLLDLDGYVLKRGSPSCGMERVRVYDDNGVPSRSGRGVFAEVLLEAMPNLPVEEEGRLNDPALRENFFARVEAYARVKELFRSDWGLGELSRFHAQQKLQLLAHDPHRYRLLGRLVAGAKGRERAELAAEYTEIFMAALRSHTTRGKHTNVLQHMLGYFSQEIDEAERRELLALVEDYRLGHLPLGVPLALLRHHLARRGVSYLLDQTYQAPYRKELRLMNAV